MARLREAGIDHLSLIGRGAYAGRVSLGVYNGTRSAERRRAALTELGFEAKIAPLRRTQRTWRVELRLPAGLAPQVLDQVAAFGERMSVKAIAALLRRRRIPAPRPLH